MKNSNFVKKTIRGVTISLCIFAGLTSTTNGIPRDDDKYVLMKQIDTNPKYLLNQVEEETNIDTKDNTNLVLIHAIINNKKLAEEEKNYFYNLVDLISENPYIDVKKTYSLLEDLDIVYTTRPKGYDETVKAIYSEAENEIKVFEDKDNFNKSIFYHELIHSIFTNKNTINLPKFLLEGQTELLANEYLSDNPFIERTTYPFEVSMVKLLCEMAGEDEVLKTYTTGDTNTLCEKLSLNNDYYEGYYFLTSIETIFKAFQEQKTIPVEEYNKAVTYIDNFFTNKYQFNQEKIQLYSYYKELLYLINNKKPYEKYLEYLDENGVIVKAYFSEKLRELYPTPMRAYLEKKQEKVLVK